MRYVMTDKQVFLEPVRLIPPPKETSFGLILPASAVEPHPHIARLACHSARLAREEGIVEGDLVVFSLRETLCEMPIHGHILLVTDYVFIHGKVELDAGWTVIASRDPLPQELAPGLNARVQATMAADAAREAARVSEELDHELRMFGVRGAMTSLSPEPEPHAFDASPSRTSPATPRALAAAELGAEQTNPEPPPEL